jgi:hypothetical protein
MASRRDVPPRDLGGNAAKRVGLAALGSVGWLIGLGY